MIINKTYVVTSSEVTAYDAIASSYIQSIILKSMHA